MHTPVENYFTTTMVLLAVNLVWILAAVWQAFGFVAVLLVAAILNHMISRLDQRRRRGTDTSGHGA
jgi:hypothetical protein